MVHYHGKFYTFNNKHPEKNSEHLFYESICKDCNVIFDVGCRTDSIYLDFTGEGHYFDPDSNFIKNIKTIKNSNKSAYFNEFGLSKITEIKNYYPAKQSFTWKVGNPIKLPLKKGSEYVIEKNIKTIDFLKIDTEGSEFDIIKGFGNFLNNIKIIQFEYGGTYVFNNVKLNDVINYLKNYNFNRFSYLSPTGPIPIQMCDPIEANSSPESLALTKSKIVSIKNDIIPDHYNLCNIVCFNKYYF